MVRIIPPYLFTVQAVAQELSGFKKRYVLFFDIYRLAGTGVSPHPRIPPLYRKRPKTSELHPLSAGHGSNNLFKDCVYDFLDVALVKVRIFVCDLLDKFRPDHGFKSPFTPILLLVRILATLAL
jgi:hypothetical protein